jgi:hypothetical protein
MAARVAKKKNNPAVADEERYRRVLSGYFAGLVARLRAEGWDDRLIMAALAENLNHDR